MNMYSVLYLDVKESDKQSGSLILTYYMLSFSGQYITTKENEKEYGVSRYQSEEQVVSKVAELVNSVCSDLDTLLILSGRSDLTDLLSKVEERLYVPAKLTWQRLQDYLECPNFTLFEIYSHYFNVDESYGLMEIIDGLISGVVRCKYGSRFEESSSFLVIQPLVRGDLAIITFAWAKLSVNNEVTILGTEQCSLPDVEDNYCRVGVFFKTLETKIASTGVAYDSLIPVFYTEQYYNTYRNLMRGMDVEVYSEPVYLQDLLLSCVTSRLRDKIGSSYSKMMRVFSDRIREEYYLAALRLCTILKLVSTEIKLCVNDERLEATGILRKDFSSDVLAPDYKLSFRYGIVLDCEGNAKGGCSEVGGIIFGYNKQRNIIVKLETFHFKRMEFTEGMQDILNRYSAVSGRYIGGTIPVLTYGKTDEIMIGNEMTESVPRSIRKRIQKSLNFIDAQDFINEYLEKSPDSSGMENRKLSTVAAHLGVKIISPKHNALSDAKTLFNVLAYICFTGEELVI